MRDFKSIVEADNKAVFLNSSEFAEIHTIKYDGSIYEDIPVLLTKVKESKRTVLANDHMQGIHKVSVIVHIAMVDLDDVIPEQKQIIQISDGMALGAVFYRKYTIVTVDIAMGMITLELEAFDE